MIKKITLAVILLLVAGLVTTSAYVFKQTVPLPRAVAEPVQTTMEATPDSSVAVGPVTAITKTSITIKKQNGIMLQFGITASTTVLLSGENGQAGTLKTLSAISVGTRVLITPNKEANTAVSIVILPLPPTQ